MAEYKTPGIWKWSLLLLVVCNIGLILTIWLKPHWGNNAHPGGPRDYVIHTLKFTDDQVKQYDVLIKDHHNTMIQLGQQSREYRTAFFENLRAGAHNLNVDSVAQLIANNQKQIELVTYRHFEQVRRICTEEQKAIFDKIIVDVTKTMNGGKHDGPPPPHDGQGPPPPDKQDGDHPQGPPPNGAQNP